MDDENLKIVLENLQIGYEIMQLELRNLQLDYWKAHDLWDKLY